jgi:hypothetical protein
MSTRDDKYTHGGTDDVDGEYEETNSVAARVGRLITMERGNWPGSGGVTMGSELYTLIHDTPENRAAIPGMIETALEPLSAAGEIDNIVTSVVDIRDGAIGFVVTYTDKTTGDSSSHEVPAPWTG